MLETESKIEIESTQEMQINGNFLNSVPGLKDVNELAERLDFMDVIILKKFYLSNKDSLSNTTPYCFPILFKEMKDLHKMKIGIEALRKRLKVLTDVGLLVKVSRSNPSTYLPSAGKELFVKAVITKFFLLSGITKFM